MGKSKQKKAAEEARRREQDRQQEGPWKVRYPSEKHLQEDWKDVEGYRSQVEKYIQEVLAQDPLQIGKWMSPPLTGCKNVHVEHKIRVLFRPDPDPEKHAVWILKLGIRKDVLDYLPGIVSRMELMNEVLEKEVAAGLREARYGAIKTPKVPKGHQKRG